MKNKKTILWISPYAPYDKVAHGGGKTHNFYIKYFHKSGKYDITLLSLCQPEEEQQLDLKKYGIKNNVYVMDKTKMERYAHRLFSGLSYWNPYDKYGGICLNFERYQMKRMIREYAKIGKNPKVVILQWTFSVMLQDEIRRYFPKSKIIAIEEDVTFLNYERKLKNAEGRWKQFFWQQRFDRMKQKELRELQRVDQIVTNNLKDTHLLISNYISPEKIFTAAPYIEDYSQVERKPKGKKIIFFGAMSRPENYQSAIWFIEKVMPLIKDKGVKFYVIGGQPHSELLKYASEEIVITGYVKDVSHYFAECICMVAPLVGGAGIKIKVLEAMSAGVPVLTNDIGIEGIEAVAEQDYLHCTLPEEYAKYINKRLDGQCEINTISENAKFFIKRNYNLSERLDELMKII